MGDMKDSPKKRAPLRLRPLWNMVREHHRHVVVGQVNDHEIKIAVNEDPSEWHCHPDSDEFFLTLEGSLIVEFRDSEIVTLDVGEGLVVEAGAVHRSIPTGRTVNLLVEHCGITTTFETGRGGIRKGSSAQAR